MNTVALEFKTYVDDQFSLRNLSIAEYVHDPRFAVHGLALRQPGGDAEWHQDVPGTLKKLQQRFGVDLAEVTVVGHHLHLGLYILNHRYGIRPKHFVDTMLLGRHVHGRNTGSEEPLAVLRALACRYGLQEPGDDDPLRGVKQPKPLESAALANRAKSNVALIHRLFEKLMPKVDRPEIELPVMMHTVRLFTERSIRVDIDRIDMVAAAFRTRSVAASVAAGVTNDQLACNATFHAELEQRLAVTERRIPHKNGKDGPIPATAKSDEQMTALAEDHDPRVAALAKARITTVEAEHHTARLDKLRRITRATHGDLPPCLVYYGAHTGRFAGGGGFNVQNLGRGGEGAAVRGLLVPRAGHLFVIGDLAQIEARVTAWYAGQTAMLEAFADGRDLYAEFASEVFGTEVRKAASDDDPATQQWLTALRQVGKAAVLGLGFGMGAKRFKSTLEQDPTIAPLFESGELTAQNCVGIVNTFRRRRPQIPQLWKDLEHAARTAAAYGEAEAAGIRFRGEGASIVLQLPSRRHLRYQEVAIDPVPRPRRYLGADGAEHEFTPSEPALTYGQDKPLYGAKLCENIVQATARDLLVESILRLEGRRLPVVLHVHDEIVAELPEAEVEGGRQVFEEQMTQRPQWAPDLLVHAEVRTATSYGE